MHGPYLYSTLSSNTIQFLSKGALNQTAPVPSPKLSLSQDCFATGCVHPQVVHAHGTPHRKKNRIDSSMVRTSWRCQNCSLQISLNNLSHKPVDWLWWAMCFIWPRNNNWMGDTVRLHCFLFHSFQNLGNFLKQLCDTSVRHLFTELGTEQGDHSKAKGDQVVAMSS